MSDEIRIDRTAVEAREVDGELVILDLKGHQYLGGNRAAAALWPLLHHGASRDDLIERLMHEFGLPRERATTDVDAFLERLRERSLLE